MSTASARDRCEMAVNANYIHFTSADCRRTDFVDLGHDKEAVESLFPSVSIRACAAPEHGQLRDASRHESAHVLSCSPRAKRTTLPPATQLRMYDTYPPALCT